MKVLDQFLHEGYHHELCKLSCDFIMVTDRQLWNRQYRPVPENVTFIDKEQLTKQYVETFDVAIIRNYRQFHLLRHCNIPKIIVMHCSKQGQGDTEFATEDLKQYVVVFNSYKDQIRAI